MRVCYSDGRPSKWIDEDNMTGKLTFTDDDLQKLKGFISIDDFYKPIGGHYMRPLVKALIARLEAAEDCVDHSACWQRRKDMGLLTKPYMYWTLLDSFKIVGVILFGYFLYWAIWGRKSV
jgi:hypothetical protein